VRYQLSGCGLYDGSWNNDEGSGPPFRAAYFARTYGDSHGETKWSQFYEGAPPEEALLARAGNWLDSTAGSMPTVGACVDATGRTPSPLRMEPTRSRATIAVQRPTHGAAPSDQHGPAARMAAGGMSDKPSM